MTKPKIGLFVPLRPDNHLQLDLSATAVGCLWADIHTPLLYALRSAEGVELVEDLNIHEALIHDGRIYCGDVCLNELDRFFWYSEVDRRPGSFDLEVLHTLARSVAVIRKPDRFETALDKFRAHQCLREAGVPVAESVLFDHRVPRRMTQVLEEWGAAVLKPRRGGWGKGVTLIDSAASLRDVIGYVRSTAGHAPDHGFFLERYYENDPAHWASITMINGEIAYGYRKTSARFHDFGQGRLKVQDLEQKGGGVVLADLTSRHKEMAHQAFEAMGLGLIGFDMIMTPQGPIVVDENTSPGNYPELYAQVGKDAAGMFARWILTGQE
ncbi:MAG: hypothetical protein D6722_20565 [Bacteroidetes bacterium]|nr:MAG: hypothetical protein D6722_20565 [Bacteroidota bacterium]